MRRQKLRQTLFLSGLVCISGCASLPPGAALPKPASTALDPSVDGTLKRAFAPLAAAHAGDSGFRLVSAGISGLTARIEMIDAVEHTLDLQSYIIRADESGNLIVLALLRAAERGVRVRILVDDGETVPGDEQILSLAGKPHIEVRIFNPLRYRGHNRVMRGAEFVLYERRLDYRMHNKLMVADNAAAIIGGRNIGDQYFQIDPQSQFGDDDVLVAGAVVRQLSGVFDEFWNSRLAVPAQAVDPRHTAPPALDHYQAALQRYRELLQAKRHAPTAAPAPTTTPAPTATHAPTATPIIPGATPFADVLSGRTPLYWSRPELVYDSPDKKSVGDGDTSGKLIYQPVEKRAALVDTELLLVSPFFVPAPDELATLQQVLKRHAKLRILTNSLEAAPELAAHSGYMHYRVGLLRDGAELHEVRAHLGNSKGSGQSKSISRFGNYGLHAKLYVFDRKTLFVGSMNFDQRSKHLNTEIGLLIPSPELSREAALRFDALTQLDNAYAVSLSDPSGGAKQHLVWTTRVDGDVVRTEVEPSRGAWQRFAVDMLSLLPLDREL